MWLSLERTVSIIVIIAADNEKTIIAIHTALAPQMRPTGAQGYTPRSHAGGDGAKAPEPHALKHKPPTTAAHGRRGKGAQEKTDRACEGARPQPPPPDKPNIPDKRWKTDKQGAAWNTALAMRGVSWGDNEPPTEPPAHCLGHLGVTIA